MRGGTAAAADAARLEGKLVLLAEDEFILALDVEQMLRGCGCGVLGPFASIEAALAGIEAQRPDLAVLDVQLLDGWAVPVAELMRRLDVPFVLTTGYASDDLRDEALRGAPCLVKPYGAGELLALLAKLTVPPEA